MSNKYAEYIGLSVRLPRDLDRYVEQATARLEVRGRATSKSEYIRYLIEKDRDEFRRNLKAKASINSTGGICG